VENAEVTVSENTHPQKGWKKWSTSV